MLAMAGVPNGQSQKDDAGMTAKIPSTASSERGEIKVSIIGMSTLYTEE